MSSPVPAPSLPTTPVALDRVERRRLFTVLGLFIVAFLLGQSVPYELPVWVGLVWAATTLFVGLYLYAPARAFLEALLDDVSPLSVVALGAALAFWFSLSFSATSLALLIALVLLLGIARAHGALGPFEPRLLWKGGWGRRLLFLGALFAGMFLADPWDMEIRHPGFYGHAGGYETAHHLGIAFVPLLLLGLCLLVVAGRGLGRGAVRLVPLIITLGLGLWVAVKLNEVHQSALAFNEGSHGLAIESGGPMWFLLVLALLMLPGALLFWRWSDPEAVNSSAPTPGL